MLKRFSDVKVPEITPSFWITKILTTAMGEATSDALNQHPGPVVAVPMMLVGLGLALLVQFRMRRFAAWSYWLVVVMVAVFGTSAADALHVVLGIPYTISTTFYLIVLALVFWRWYASEKTLSIHSISTPRRELFYWSTVLATFALGTAAGDLTATRMGLGYLASAAMFGVVLVIPAVAYWRFGLNEIVAFWFAYIVTRPFGASVADWLENSHRHGGLGLGAGPVSIGFSITIILLVGYLTVTGKGLRHLHPLGRSHLGLEPTPAVE